jgi:hypothetical protein
MTSLNKAAKNRLNRLDRKTRNRAGKSLRAIERNDELVAFGKTLVPKEVPTGLLIDGVAQKKTIYVEQTIPRGPRGMYGMTSRRDSFLSGKSFSQSNGGRKNRPGNKELHNDALVLNSTFVPKPKPTPDIPVIDVEQPIMGEYAEKFAEIGEFADRDPQQGAAIDHSIATGDPLFAERIMLGDSDVQATE